MPGGSGSDDDSTDVEPAWHERPSTLAGASVGALIVLAILFWGASCASREFNAPEPAPQYFLDPSTSGGYTPTYTGSNPSSTTVTETITSTSPPVTTDIDPGDTSSTTPTSSTDTTTSFNPSNLPRTRSPSTYDDGRTRPRFNETRTGFPRP